MTMLTSATHPHDSTAHEDAMKALAREAHVPIEQVAQLYAHELAVLTAGARITSFLTILTTRKVREILRQGHYPACSQRVTVQLVPTSSPFKINELIS